LVIVEPLLFPVRSGEAAAGTPDPIRGLLDLVGLLAFAACIGARSAPGIVSGLMARGDVLYAVGPLLGAFAFTVDDIGAKFGLEGDAGLVVVAAAIVVAIVARRLVPPLSRDKRRSLVTPFILVTSRFFGQVEEVEEAEIDAAFATARTLGLPAVRGEIIEGDVAGYHYYPGRERVMGWLEAEGLFLEAEAVDQEDGWRYRHLLVRGREHPVRAR
jgi:hypothetical protein